jgi:hypothetical protein
VTIREQLLMPETGAKRDNKVIEVSFSNHHINALDNNIFVLYFLNFIGSADLNKTP